MEKQEINVELDYELDWAYYVSVEQLKKDIEELERLGADYVELDSPDGFVYFKAFCTRMETDNELQERIKSVQIMDDENTRRELELLEQLKLKYGK